jgi:predicted amidohydrolase
MLTGWHDSEAQNRRHSLAADGPEIAALLDESSRFSTTFIVGFGEVRGSRLFQSALVAEGGALLGVYSKAIPWFSWHTPGRDFPVFERKEVKFGVILCNDGCFVEPSHILALKGARIIFAPHYTYLPKEILLPHFLSVRAQHTARAIENNVWFLRGSNVVLGERDPCMPSVDGVGYGDSYLMDPYGELLVRSQRNVECFVHYDVDVSAVAARQWPCTTAAQELGSIIQGILKDEPLER